MGRAMLPPTHEAASSAGTESCQPHLSCKAMHGEPECSRGRLVQVQHTARTPLSHCPPPFCTWGVEAAGEGRQDASTLFQAWDQHLDDQVQPWQPSQHVRAHVGNAHRVLRRFLPCCQALHVSANCTLALIWQKLMTVACWEAWPQQCIGRTPWISSQLI